MDHTSFTYLGHEITDAGPLTRCIYQRYFICSLRMYAPNLGKAFEMIARYEDKISRPHFKITVLELGR